MPVHAPAAGASDLTVMRTERSRRGVSSEPITAFGYCFAIRSTSGRVDGRVRIHRRCSNAGRWLGCSHLPSPCWSAGRSDSPTRGRNSPLRAEARYPAKGRGGIPTMYGVTRSGDGTDRSVCPTVSPGGHPAAGRSFTPPEQTRERRRQDSLPLARRTTDGPPTAQEQETPPGGRSPNRPPEAFCVIGNSSHNPPVVTRTRYLETMRAR